MVKKTEEKTVEGIVRSTIKGHHVEVVNQIYTIKEYIERGYYNEKELEEYAPLFSRYSLIENKRILRKCTKRLLEEIEKEERTYLETLKILGVLDVLGVSHKVLQKNKKVKFCKGFYEIMCASEEPEKGFKTIAILDKN